MVCLCAWIIENAQVIQDAELSKPERTELDCGGLRLSLTKQMRHGTDQSGHSISPVAKKQRETTQTIDKYF
jgi:hypothetical protein